MSVKNTSWLQPSTDIKHGCVLCCECVNESWQDFRSYSENNTSDSRDEQHSHKFSQSPFKHAVITSGELQVGRAGQKKKARMARTRSDFLTRAPVLSVGGDSDEDDYDGDSPLSPLSPRHYTLPLSKQSSAEASLGESCLSDSDMVTGASTAAAALSTLLKLASLSNPLSREEHRSASQL